MPGSPASAAMTAGTVSSSPAGDVHRYRAWLGHALLVDRLADHCDGDGIATIRPSPPLHPHGDAEPGLSREHHTSGVFPVATTEHPVALGPGGPPSGGPAPRHHPTRRGAHPGTTSCEPDPTQVRIPRRRGRGWPDRRRPGGTRRSVTARRATQTAGNRAAAARSTCLEEAHPPKSGVACTPSAQDYDRLLGPHRKNAGQVGTEGGGSAGLNGLCAPLPEEMHAPSFVHCAGGAPLDRAGSPAHARKQHQSCSSHDERV